jgi:hypothetical protein
MKGKECMVATVVALNTMRRKLIQSEKHIVRIKRLGEVVDLFVLPLLTIKK